MAAEQSQTYRFYRRNTSGSTFSERLVFHEDKLPSSLPLPSSVLIRVYAVSLNYRDSNILNGTNPWPTRADGIPCSDAAGEVFAIGSAVDRVAVGDRVAIQMDQKAITGREQEREWLGGEVDGVLATHVIFDEKTVVKIPEGLSYAEASCLPNAGLTAFSALSRNGSLIPGMSVLISGKTRPGPQWMQAQTKLRNGGCEHDGSQDG